MHRLKPSKDVMTFHTVISLGSLGKRVRISDDEVIRVYCSRCLSIVFFMN